VVLLLCNKEKKLEFSGENSADACIRPNPPWR
jgi:hypothetical protein